MRCAFKNLLTLSAFPLAAFYTTVMAQPSPPSVAWPRIESTDCWKIHSLGTFGGDNSYAYDVNDSGQVVGTAATEPRIFDPADPPRSYYPAFISAPNGGTLTQIVTDGKWGARATAVSNAGEVVGDTTIGSSFPTTFYTEPGGLNPRNTMSFAFARDINNVGQTLWDRTYSSFQSVFGPNLQSWDSEPVGLIEADVLPLVNDADIYLESAAFNDAGQVALTVSTSKQTEEGYYSEPAAYRWSNYEGPIKLAPDAITSTAKDINAIGQVVGVLTREGVAQQAFVTRRYNSALVLLGQPGDGNEPTGINNHSQIVGTHKVNGITHGYVTAPYFVHQTISIDTLNEVLRGGWSSMWPEAINNRGQIAGTGMVGGFYRAFLLTPLSLQAYLPTREGKPAKCYRLTP
jgi:uncharacterized membrane protein